MKENRGKTEELRLLNESIIKNDSFVFNLLSKKGKEIYFPNKGIPSQSAQAKGKRINATIGVAMEENGQPMHLDSYSKELPLNPREIFSYAPASGVSELREYWKKKILEENRETKISTPITTAGLTNGLSIAGHLFIDEKDEIITPKYYWENYSAIFEHNYGGKIKTFKGFTNTGFSPEALDKELKSKKGKTIILFTFPSNPTGYSPNKEEAKKIIVSIKKHAEKNPTLIILDDAYTGFFYEEETYKKSLFYELSEIENVLVVKIDGITKEDYAWGLRVGFITFGGKNLKQETFNSLENKTTGIIRGYLSNISNLTQNLMLKAIKSKTYNQEKKQKFEIMKKRYIKIKKILEEKKYSEYLEAMPFNSGYFLCLSLKGKDAEQMRKKLLEKYDTGTVELEGFLRIAYSSVREEDLPELIENIYKACKEK